MRPYDSRSNQGPIQIEARSSKRRTTLHPAWTYTLHDLAGSGWGVLAFASAAVAPGFCMGHLCAPGPFRARGLREQLAWAVALSLGPGVLGVVGIVAMGGAHAGAAFLLACALAAVWLAWKYPPVCDVSRRQLLLALAVFSAGSLLVLASLVDIGTHDRLWMSVTSYDHGLRTAFVEAILRTGIAPVDPVYWPGHDVAMRYYYFWYAVCASVARLAHISGRDALIASCAWPPAGVVAMLALFGRYVLLRRGRQLARLIVTASGLLAVTGLDILVTIALRLLHTPVLADMEWWSLDQVASWPDTFLWVPHHAASLVASLLGLLLLRLAAESEFLRTRAALAAVAGLSFASAFGMSAYVGVGAAVVAVGLLFPILVARTLPWRYLQGLFLAGLTAAVADGRFLFQLTRRQGTGGGRSSPLYLGLREILSPVVMAGSPLFHSLAAQHPWRARELAAAILLLPGWGVELGFYAVVLLAALFRWRRLGAGERTIVWLALVGLAGASVLRSGVIATNDFGIRAALLPQFFLLLIGAVVFPSSAGGFRRFLWLLVAVGVAGCVYQVVLLRTYLPWQEAHRNPEVQQVGERTYALREAYGAMQGAVPDAARLQFDTAATSFFLYPHLFYGNRQIVTAEITCSTSYGGDPAACPGLQRGIAGLFPADPASTPDAPQAEEICASLGAQYLVVTRWDAAWQAGWGWVWALPAVVEQPSARVVRCRPTI